MRAEQMNFNVTNHGLTVGYLRIIGVTSASVVLVGDAGKIGAASVFDTPPESLIIGEAFVPLAAQGASR